MNNKWQLFLHLLSYLTRTKIVTSFEREGRGHYPLWMLFLTTNHRDQATLLGNTTGLQHSHCIMANLTD